MVRFLEWFDGCETIFDTHVMRGAFKIILIITSRFLLSSKMSEDLPDPKVEAPVSSSQTEGTTDEKKLSNKELKELKKQEKAAKRAAEKLAKGITEEQQKESGQRKMEKKQATVTNTNLKKQLNQTVIKDADAKKKIPLLFSHLETREQRNASSPAIAHLVHPAILALTLNYSTYKVVGSIPRLRRMLEVFQQVIQDYHTPANTTLTRHLSGYLSNQIDYLKTARPLSVSMGNAIRWLKQEISHISIDSTEQQAKDLICGKIDDFIREKIVLSDQLIVENASQHITSGCTILTYGHSLVLEDLFRYCVKVQEKSFTLIVVDSRPLFEGKKLLRNLVGNSATEEKCAESDAESVASSAMGQSLLTSRLKIHYVLLNLLSSPILEHVDCVFLGAHSMLSNGQLYSRVGTALIAMMCHSRNIPVLTCCESIKFSDKVQLDSVTTNELADSDDLVDALMSKEPPRKKCFALEQFIKQCEEEKNEKLSQSKGKQSQKAKVGGEEAQVDSSQSPLKDWKKIDNLNILNIMYDLTPPEFIKKVVTEFGSLPPSSVPVILREYKNT